jgi:hypothetical protein
MKRRIALIVVILGTSFLYAGDKTRIIETVYDKPITYEWNSFSGTITNLVVPEELLRLKKKGGLSEETLNTCRRIPPNSKLVVILSPELVIFKLYGGYYLLYNNYREGSIDYLGEELPEGLVKEMKK